MWSLITPMWKNPDILMSHPLTIDWLINLLTLIIIDKEKLYNSHCMLLKLQQKYVIAGVAMVFEANK